MRILNTTVAAKGSNDASLTSFAEDSALRVQVSFDPGLSGTVTIRGKLHPECVYVDMATTTQNELFYFNFVDYIEAELSNVSGADGVRRCRVEVRS